MRILADESCADGAIVRALLDAGHDVRLVATDMRGADDDVLVTAALADDRILITKDRDFGHLVFVRSMPTSGVVYVRWPVVLRARLAPRLVAVFRDFGDQLRGAFVTVRPDRVRIRHRPPN